MLFFYCILFLVEQKPKWIFVVVVLVIVVLIATATIILWIWMRMWWRTMLMCRWATVLWTRWYWWASFKHAKINTYMCFATLITANLHFTVVGFTAKLNIVPLTRFYYALFLWSFVTITHGMCVVVLVYKSVSHCHSPLMYFWRFYLYIYTMHKKSFLFKSLEVF